MRNTRPARPSRRAKPAHSSAREGGSAPAGCVWLFGTHAVSAALCNPRRVFQRLLLTDQESAILQGADVKHRPEPELVARSVLDELLGPDAVHQGVAALVKTLPDLSLAEAVERPGPVLVLDQVTDPRNVGAILRSAAAFGAACLVVQDRNAPEETAVLAKAASGALEVVPVVREVNISRAIEALQKANFWTIGLDAGGGLLEGASLTGRRVALVLGAEGKGLRRLVRESCDEIAGLYMPGDMESLNVSVAAAVGLYELVRERAPSAYHNAATKKPI
ncbi:MULTISPECIES: 23S rRNA (guanosine(2251)-2'-O)-methyltransferase RlmB [Acetobacter]|uniref:23S rRNA (Guanosine(2251)-2'-O)-methyltransferase RlmB n=1 Tax=Acetobacter thailandicus TaxID=1502842 RepID=A0ABT3QBT6_9PROT|nr:MULTISPECIES: 23S rRNA (guanosine(2251)-2'-O)-methyltransferase RlmB [Acetobacter]MBS0980478.1 23S rRNA (guanosine(2251)-2'-O)-methyltransferase RlmB [Acetobacter thailandicus]MBS1003472.1 23S rRNA (guanosine(2251)-2'-O)-methyltransferase RlmB [Acetobacter thailandicus]MCX2562694.1 23S rRNA (guanosine(2251)-2'-O)-methyltransferase RlmB [Acetobacter thailandicus]NHN94759.1 23S rRNA (guanosine(2251)-2'-O)-methyltransferase RlmB [Acetobacter thailandicus]OUI89578.1 ribosomal large subunit pseu